MHFIRPLKISGAEESPSCEQPTRSPKRGRNRHSPGRTDDAPHTHGRDDHSLRLGKAPLTRARVLPELSDCKIMPRGAEAGTQTLRQKILVRRTDASNFGRPTRLKV
jgi:hypothetical protein